MQKIKTADVDNLIGIIPEWVNVDSINQDVVLMSRIMLYRNFSNYVFPEKAGLLNMVRLKKEIFSIIGSYKNKNDFRYFNGTNMNDEEFLLLKEYLMLGTDCFKTEKEKTGIIADDILSTFILVNADNHIALIKNISDSFFKKSFSNIYSIERYFEKYLTYAFSGTYGYLTSSLNTSGTGLKLEVLLDLTGISNKNKFDSVDTIIKKFKISIEKFPYEGYETTSFYKISNRITIGMDENEIIDNMIKAIKEIISCERRNREDLTDDLRFKDKIIRNYAIFKDALLMSDNEILQTISLLRLGIIFGWITDIDLKATKRILLETGARYLKMKYKLNEHDFASEIMRIRKSHINKILEE